MTKSGITYVPTAIEDVKKIVHNKYTDSTVYDKIADANNKAINQADIIDIKNKFNKTEFANGCKNYPVSHFSGFGPTLDLIEQIIKNYINL